MPSADPPAAADPSYRLVLFEAPEDPAAVRDLIARVTGQHPTDVMQWVARAPGIWPHPLAEPEVRAILDGLYEQRVPAEAWRLDRLPVLSPARTVHDLLSTPDGLQVRGLRGEPTHWLPWDRLELIDAGRIEQPDELRVIAPPGWVQSVSVGLNALLRRPLRVARRERSMRITREPVAEMILVRREPRLALRASAAGLTYASLGRRKQPNAAANFRALLTEITVRAEGAYLTASTRALLAGDEGPATLYPTSQALLDHATHRLLWSWYRRDRDGA